MPPRPPLFPYTTLFRSREHPRRHLGEGDAAVRTGEALGKGDRFALRNLDLDDSVGEAQGGLQRVGQARAEPVLDDEPVRSEEHTSELQSPYDLVCRLLL